MKAHIGELEEFLSQSAQDFIEDLAALGVTDVNTAIPEPISSGLH